MKSKIGLIAIITTIFFLLITTSKSKFLISRLIYSHNFSLLTHSVFKEIKKKYLTEFKKTNNKFNQLIILNAYVESVIRPFKNKRDDLVWNVLDDGASWKMLDGSIWCDGSADIFIRLSNSIDVNSAIIFLFNKDNVSDHVVAFSDLNNKTNNFKSLEKINEAFLFDAHFYFLPIDKKREKIDINFMVNNQKEFMTYKAIDNLNNKKILFSSNEKTLTEKITYKVGYYLVQFIPKQLFKKIYKFAININPKLDSDYKEFISARVDHLLYDYDSALENYKKIKKSSKYYKGAEYWADDIIKNKNKNDDLNEIYENYKKLYN